MKYSKLVLFLSLLIAFTSCEKYEFDDCPQPPNTVTVDTANTSIVTDDYPNLSGKWLLYEGIRYTHTEGMVANDTYEVTQYSLNGYENVYNSPQTPLDSVSVNNTVWELTYNDLLVNYQYNFVYVIGNFNNTIEISTGGTKRIFTILEYENLGTELRIKTSNQEWLENGVPMYQFSILKFYKI